jgi:VWFA-related protein
LQIKAGWMAACLFVASGLSGWAQQGLPDAPAPKLPRNENPMPDTAPLPPAAAQNPAPQRPSAPVTPPSAKPNLPPSNVANPEVLENVIRVSVRLKILPVTVRDNSGKLVQDLQQDDFAVYENGEKQQVRYFSSDPFPLSAAVLIDTGMPGITLDKVQKTLSAIQGAFGPYDEVAVYSYGGTVTRQADFGSISNANFALALDKVQKITNQPSGVPITSGPLASGPMINNIPVDPTTRPPGMNQSNVRPSRVLNDALLQAAGDLSRRARGRRRMILVVSDGMEYNSRNSYSDVLKVLLNDEIIVDAIATGEAGIAGVGKLDQLHIPRFGYTNLLPKYTNATGGVLFREISQENIAQAYAQATFNARSQYTLGYTPKAADVTSNYRQIEVRVHRPNLNVYAPDGYYALPPRQAQQTQ